MKTELDERTGLIYGEDDLPMRLGKTLVRYDGEPFFITHFEGLFGYGRFTATDKESFFHLPDRGLDVRPVPIGYVNTSRSAVYCTRQPARRYKQGLSEEALRVQGEFPPGVVLTSKAMADCVLNQYPSFADALRKVRIAPYTSVAFSRRFCIEKDGTGVLFLQYRGDNVGWIDKDKPELGESHIYLAEELAIAMGGNV